MTLPSLLSWTAVLALLWFAACMPAPHVGKAFRLKALAIVVFGMVVFYYAFR